MPQFLRTPGLLLAMFFVLTALTLQAQVAEFSFVQSSNCYPQTVKFKDESQGNITKWVWDFGNGSKPEYTTLPEVISAAYTEPGTYTVTLTVFPSGNSKTRELIVREKPEVEFSHTPPAESCAPIDVSFEDLSTDVASNNFTYTWIFGDGGSSTQKNPVHQYTIPGDYSVTLIVTNEFGCESSLFKGDLIHVTGPIKDFTFDTESSFCDLPVTVNFDAGTTDATSYQWDFGDDTDGEGKSIAHEYDTPGLYIATLTIKDENGCTATESKEILIGDAGGIELLASAEQVCPGSNINFSQSVSGVIQTISWDFGDGTSASYPDPSKAYLNTGTYTVTLTVQIAGKDCSSTATKEIDVLGKPEPSFKFKATCEGKVTFTNTSTNSNAWQWNFGDGSPQSSEKSPTHQYQNLNRYQVTLSATNSAGCSSTIQESVRIDPLPTAYFSPSIQQDCDQPSLSGCAPFDLELENFSFGVRPLEKVKWDFGDGTTSDSEDKKLQHTFTNPGKYTLKLVVTDSAGCVGSKTAEVNVADEIPIADFGIEDTVVCPGQEIKFTNLSQDATFFCWNLGDSTRLSTRDVVHKYTEPGKYDVTLLAKNAGCENEKKVVAAVHVQPPKADFEVIKECETPYDVKFTNLSEDFDSFAWSFGDGTFDSTNNEVEHHYNTTGEYQLLLKVSSATTGCEMTVGAGITIQKIKADFDLDKLNVCLGDSLRTFDQSEFAAVYSWDFGTGGSPVGGPSPRSIYTTPGFYDVKLTVEDSDGCTDEKSLNIKVLDIVGDFSTSLHSYCDSLEVSFTDESVANPPISQWYWDFGDGKTSDEQNPTNMFYENDDYNIRLKITNEVGEFCELLRLNEIKFTRPNPNFILNKPGYCPDEQILFVNTTSFDYTFEWFLGNGATSTERNPVTHYTHPGRYSVTLIARDNLGCADSTTKEDFVAITKPQAEFTAGVTFTECPPLSTSFQNASINATSWFWDLGDGKSSIFENPLHTYVRPGAYDISLIATDSNGCQDTVIYEKKIIVGGPDGTINVSPLTVCEGDTVQYHAAATNALVYKWDFGDGNIIDLPHDETYHQYASTGTANISAIFIDANGCAVAAQDTVTVNIVGLPDAAFSYDIQYPMQDETVTLTAETTKASTFEWYVDSVLVATEKVSPIVFGTSGTRLISLKTANENLCVADTTMQIIVQANIPFVPNVFTPNYDYYNQNFDIPFVREGFWNLLIYNRWGEVVYKQDHYQGNWNAEDLASGVYYYYLNNQYRAQSFKGYVQVMK